MGLIDAVQGLKYLPGYLAPVDQDRLLGLIDQQPWITDLKRRTQHYGYRYNYSRRTVDPSLFLGPLPTWAGSLAERLYRDSFTDKLPDQLIVNEYMPGQGIASHIDCLTCFGDTILSLSLGSPCAMVFTQVETGRRASVVLEPGSLVVMHGEARRAWRHGIPPRKTDLIQGRHVARGRRLSLTFREVLLQERPGK